MTVLFFARRFYPLIGGVEKHVLEVGKRLVKKGFKVIVITENYNLSRSNSYQLASPTDKIEGIEIIRIDAGKEDKLKKFRIWFRLLKYLKVIGSADIVHCHDIFFWYLPFRFIFPTKKVYTTFHGYEGNELPTKKAIFMHKLAEKLSCGNICVGDYLKKWYGTKPTYVTYGAVDLVKFRAKNSKNEAVFVGRLEEETGIKKYLEAIKLLMTKGIELNMTVLGEGSLEKTTKKYVKDNKIHVAFKGFVKDVENYVNSSRFVFLSRYLGILEAMAAKKLVFSEYNNAIKKDYLEMAPFAKNIVIENSAQSIANKIEYYFKNNNAGKELIENSFDWVKNQTWEQLVYLYLRLWKFN